MINPLIRKLDRRDTLSDEEKRVLEAAVSRTLEFGVDEDIVREHDRPSESTLVLDGWTARYRHLRDGRRQILALHIAGDFVDLHSFPLKVMDHSVLAITPCKVAMIPHETLQRITERHPHLTRLLWLNTLIDAAILRQWLLNSAQHSAMAHVANLLCELFTRLRVVGLTHDFSFRLPLTQEELGHVLGISSVHVNRVLQELRAEELITWRGDRVEIRNWERLEQIGEFDPTYLHLENEPR